MAYFGKLIKTHNVLNVQCICVKQVSVRLAGLHYVFKTCSLTNQRGSDCCVWIKWKIWPVLQKLYFSTAPTPHTHTEKLTHTFLFPPLFLLTRFCYLISKLSSCDISCTSISESGFFFFSSFTFMFFFFFSLFFLPDSHCDILGQ